MPLTAGDQDINKHLIISNSLRINAVVKEKGTYQKNRGQTLNLELS